MPYSKNTNVFEIKLNILQLNFCSKNKPKFDCKSNPKKFWSYINKKTHTNVNICDLKWQDDSGKEHTAESDSEKATALQEFFASVYKVETNHEFHVLPPSGTIHKIMGVPVITKDSVEEKLAKLKINKS